jgi:hypothetical protein
MDSHNTSIPLYGNAHVTTTSDKSTPTTTVVRWDTTVDNASEQSTSATNVAEDTTGAKMDSHHTSIPFGRSKHAVAEAQTFTTEHHYPSGHSETTGKRNTTDTYEQAEPTNDHVHLNTIRLTGNGK